MIAILQKKKFDEIDFDLQTVYQLSIKISDILEYDVAPTKPIIGKNVFVHESGIHQDGTMKNFKLVAFTLMAFVACFLSACDALDFKEKLSVNKDVIDFGTEGGIDALLARSNELDVVHIRVIERATNKAVIDTALVKGQKIKELVVDGKTFCKLSYNNVYVSKMVFD